MQISSNYSMNGVPYENRYELRNQPGSVREKSNDMLDKLQHMFGV